jgi:hypothetical protein
MTPAHGQADDQLNVTRFGRSSLTGSGVRGWGAAANALAGGCAWDVNHDSLML